MKLSTNYSKWIKVNSKHVVVFLRKVNEVEFYYMGKKFNVVIKNDKNEFEITEKKLEKLVTEEVKRSGFIDPEAKKAVRKYSKKKGVEQDNVEVKEKKRRGRPKKVK